MTEAPGASIGSLHAELAKREAIVEKIRVLLEKADKRRRDEPHNASRWNRVLDNLERGLDEARAAVAARRRQIAELESQGAAPQPEPRGGSSPPAGEPSPLAEDALGAVEDLSPEEIAQRVLRAPLESVTEMRIEDMAAACQFLEEKTGGEPRTPEQKRLAGRLEVAVQLHGDSKAGTSPRPPGVDSRKQQVLRAAIDKVQGGKLDALSLEEAGMIITCWAVLSRQADPPPANERLHALARQAFEKIRDRLHVYVRMMEELGAAP